MSRHAVKAVVTVTVETRVLLKMRLMTVVTVMTLAKKIVVRLVSMAGD